MYSTISLFLTLRRTNIEEIVVRSEKVRYKSVELQLMVHFCNFTPYRKNNLWKFESSCTKTVYELVYVIWPYIVTVSLTLWCSVSGKIVQCGLWSPGWYHTFQTDLANVFLRHAVMENSSNTPNRSEKKAY